jgi:hypothetical protein
MMSAYLSRLVQRFSPPASDDGGVALQPFIRSQSPIAAIDQRLGIDESLGHGLADASGGFDEPMAESPEPVRVQRKAASANATAPSLAAPLPATRTPAANLSATHSAAHLSSPAAIPSSTPTSIPTPTSSPVSALVDDTPSVELTPRREPMDPGALFAPFALHYDATDEPGVTRGETERRTVEAALERRETSKAPSTAPRLAPSVSPAIAPRPACSEASQLTPARLANAPWVVFDRNIPTIPEFFPQPTDAPLLEPKPAPLQTERRIAAPVFEPRPPTPAPFVPEVEPAQEVARTTSPQKTTTRAHVESSPKPTSTPQTPSAPTRGKLNIDSISQIGPLARHFPNRRRLRLRFR